ncbi:MAG: hypothetical protein L6308_03320 [Candidatus Omnitrophica bacterium]|nr:hypothetical protein [Candidatus Omnitrophota bacterium]
MKNKGQGILEYAVVFGLVIIALSAMSLYFRRGIQSVIKVAADEAGNQSDAEEIDPLKGIRVSSSINRQSQSTQRSRVLQNESRISDIDMVNSASGTAISVSTQEK